MCYSALVRAQYHEFVRMFGATLSLREFVELYVERSTDKTVHIPKAMSAAFLQAQNTPEERRIVELIRAFDANRRLEIEQELFEQRTRLNDAERDLRAKVTKRASEEKRVATNKSEQARRRLDDLLRTELKPGDSRIFPNWYAPVMVARGDGYVVMPMRYRCRPAGVPESFDKRYPGCFNARRSSLSGFWKKQFGHQHGLLLVDEFFEKVLRARLEGREPLAGEEDDKVELIFSPNPRQLMLVPCVWDRWKRPDLPDLLSFAAITDEPPSEVRAAGHDRCLIPIKRGNVDVWLRPEHSSLEALDDILVDKEHPYYEHRLAA
ncbi:SOS response-associated peptidase family protein [Ralstonia sp. ASV6]|uniref:SOS response-associated peptidase family protein n=1 Tax=Ralstonia sp. ASV6 TaxID=2795124 RepID=UPI0018ED4C8B|nr:SOS response-associated peptidase family protein [Ralstonia sp. ASV6]